ncbi:MAG: kdgA [Haloplasmataceae bacterium]|jgi:2-dehydro-3-deoxyphosphogluconate aldolase/(4S)-4-hydroxy-2-oxoglutarate aldolase|nr:kdgA [Haloplasmataceae bacterium]
MRKTEVLRRIEEVGVVAVVRAENSDQAEKISQACIDGGISSIEITFTVPGADKVIKSLNEKFVDSLLIGAGTVLDAPTARIAILNGAKFIVSPLFDLETCQLCGSYQIPYMPGCMTLTEINNAMKAGADVIKIFPGEVFGPGFIKSIKGPLPQAVLMPTGGVSIENVGEWIKNGCVAVGVGSQLTAPAKKGDYLGVTELAKQFVEKVRLARG